MGTLASGSIDLKGLKTAGKTATNFLAVDSSGIMIYDGSNGAQTPSNPSSSTKNVFIDSNSVDIRDGTSVLSTFGANSIDFYGDSGAVNLTHIGYASGQGEQGVITEAPYYTFGTRDNGAIGNWSFAVGETNQASGSNSFAGGKLSVASNDYSFAFGRYGLGDHETRRPTTASGYCSFAFGDGAVASAHHTFAFGNDPIASGNGSGAFWGEATGNQAFTIHGTASGHRSFAIHGTASGAFGVALYGTASGYNSFALGKGTEAQGYSQTVIGQYNIIQGTSSSRVNTDYAFIIGNGEADTDYLSRSNAFAVTWDGTIYVNNAVMPYVVETGTHNLWKYVKWSDGRIELWGKFTQTVTSYATNAWVIGHASLTNYPSGITNPIAVATCQKIGTGGGVVCYDYERTDYWSGIANNFNGTIAQGESRDISWYVYVNARWK